jgi:hypothetical protein
VCALKISGKFLLLSLASLLSFFRARHENPSSSLPSTVPLLSSSRSLSLPIRILSHFAIDERTKERSKRRNIEEAYGATLPLICLLKPFLVRAYENNRERARARNKSERERERREMERDGDGEGDGEGEGECVREFSMVLSLSPFSSLSSSFAFTLLTTLS